MIVLTIDLREFLLKIHDQKEKEDITTKVIQYLLEENITALGFYSLLENNGIQNVQSLKKSLINLFIEIKNEIIASTHFLPDFLLQDLNTLKKLFQINESELLHYKTNEIQDIISNQIQYLINFKKFNNTDVKQNLMGLKQLLGLPIAHTSYYVNNKERLNTLKHELSV